MTAEHWKITAAELAMQLVRHEELVGGIYRDRHRVEDLLLVRLLGEHEPTHKTHGGKRYVACRTCDGGAVTWPCATWRTISENSPQ